MTLRTQMTLILPFVLLAATAPMDAAVTTQLRYDGVIIDRPGKYDSYPTHIFYNGTHHLWWCSAGSVPGSISPKADSIWHAQKPGSLGAGWLMWAEVFNHTLSPWSTNHTCDPTVLRGSFAYQGVTYSYALYWTSDTGTKPDGTGGVDNKIGVAFSNNTTTWTAYPTPVIDMFGTPDGFYGAGASSAAFDPSRGKWIHVYDDTTMGPDASRMKESTNGKVFSPTPPYAVGLDPLIANKTLASDVAWDPISGYWLAVSQYRPTNSIWIMRSLSPNNILSGWQQIGAIDQTVTGNVHHSNAGFARLGDGTLYRDAAGWAYIFMGSGTTTPTSWALVQVAFKVVVSN